MQDQYPSRCMSCGRLVRPYWACQNGMCELFGLRASGSATAVSGSVAESVTPSEEHPAITSARERISKALGAGSGQTRQVTALTFAMLAQEMGHHRIANELIDAYALTASFGIPKLS